MCHAPPPLPPPLPSQPPFCPITACRYSSSCQAGASSNQRTTQASGPRPVASHFALSRALGPAIRRGRARLTTALSSLCNTPSQGQAARSETCWTRLPFPSSLDGRPSGRPMGSNGPPALHSRDRTGGARAARRQSDLKVCDWTLAVSTPRPDSSPRPATSRVYFYGPSPPPIGSFILEHDTQHTPVCSLTHEQAAHPTLDTPRPLRVTFAARARTDFPFPEKTEALSRRCSPGLFSRARGEFVRVGCRGAVCA